MKTHLDEPILIIRPRTIYLPLNTYSYTVPTVPQQTQGVGQRQGRTTYGNRLVRIPLTTRQPALAGRKRRAPEEAGELRLLFLLLVILLYQSLIYLLKLFKILYLLKNVSHYLVHNDDRKSRLTKSKCY